jgi:glycosyltransferase involved in cell wall biosynthesis
MKIAYALRWDIGHESGVIKKVVDQVKTWRMLGHEARLFVLGAGDRQWDGLKQIDVTTTYGSGKLSRLRASTKLWRSIVDWQPDVCYLRFSTYYPGLAAMLDRVPTIIEVNTDDVEEYRRTAPQLGFYYHRATRSIVLKNCRGIVQVSHEIAGRFESWRRPQIVLGNGIALDRIEPLPATFAERPRLAFIGSKGAEWHGVDKLVRLARALPEFDFDCIGIPQVVVESSANIVFHGAQDQTAYRKTLAMADIGVSSLAMHRINLEEASPLKSREYLAFGLPVIVGYRDTDFDADHPFLLRIPNTDDNVDRPEVHASIRKFVTAWHGHRVARESIAAIDAVEKERHRLSFMHRFSGAEAV